MKPAYLRRWWWLWWRGRLHTAGLVGGLAVVHAMGRAVNAAAAAAHGVERAVGAGAGTHTDAVFIGVTSVLSVELHLDLL